MGGADDASRRGPDGLQRHGGSRWQERRRRARSAQVRHGGCARRAHAPDVAGRRTGHRVRCVVDPFEPQRRRAGDGRAAGGALCGVPPHRGLVRAGVLAGLLLHGLEGVHERDVPARRALPAAAGPVPRGYLLEHGPRGAGKVRHAARLRRPAAAAHGSARVHLQPHGDDYEQAVRAAGPVPRGGSHVSPRRCLRAPHRV
mmetsp:Transcript_3185/g.9116  ORF Transcript_3185/g.9116 Transcript_3185/m.9116 type:complete len:200 (+) Transcript_3185:411-1010(+)